MSIASFAAHASHASHASSHEDEDFKESDWRLQSDASTVSSRVTTPDLPPVSHRHLPLSSSSGSRTPFASRPPTVAPLPPIPSSPEHVSSPESRNAVLTAFTSHDSTPLDQSTFPSFVTGHSRRSIDVSQWRPQQPHLVSHGNTLPEDLPRFGSSYTSVRHMRNPARDKMASTERSRSWAPSPSPMAVARLDHAGMVASQTMTSAGSSTDVDKTPPLRPSRTTQHQSDSSDVESSTFSHRRPAEPPSWSSESSSGEDLVSYQNSRQFPPRLPATPVHQPTLRQNRAEATNRISSWVSSYENSKSPRRQRSASLLVKTLRRASESTMDESVLSDTSSIGEVEMLWQQLKQKRARVAEIRHDMAANRNELRDLRQMKNDADNTFMNMIRPMLVSRTGLPHASVQGLAERLATMQNLRDDYHYRESAYEKLETMLDDEENELNHVELRFFSLLAAGQAYEADAIETDADGTSSTSSSDAPYELIGISQDGPPEDLHPLYLELTMALGDLANSKEEYNDLLFMKKHMDYNQQLEQSTGLKSIQESEEFLEDFPSDEQRMKQSVLELQADVERLKSLCLKKNVMRKHLSVRMEYALNPNMTYEDIDLDDKSLILAKPKTLAHAQFPELLSQPDHLISEAEVLTARAAVQKADALPNNHPRKKTMHSVASKEISIDRLMQGLPDSGIGKANFVNRWLLQQLRLSPLNAWLLHSTFVISQSLKIQDHWRWQFDVLHYWWCDSTVTSVEDGTFNATVSNDSEYSFRLGSPEQSRPASDGAKKSSPPLHRRVSSGDAVTIHG